jgi:hypothetical protein
MKLDPPIKNCKVCSWESEHNYCPICGTAIDPQIEQRNNKEKIINFVVHAAIILVLFFTGIFVTYMGAVKSTTVQFQRTLVEKNAGKWVVDNTGKTEFIIFDRTPATQPGK